MAMVMKIVAVGGQPCSGKSTLMQLILSREKDRTSFKYGLLRGIYCNFSKFFVFGLYPENETFGGTDRLSMAVQRDATSFLQGPMATGKDNLIFEGDRLFNQSFLAVCAAQGELKTIVLTTTPEILKTRHSERGDSQSEIFLKGRVTKYANLLKAVPSITVRQNSTPEQQSAIATEIITFLHP